MLAIPNPICSRPASPRAARCDSATVAAASCSRLRPRPASSRPGLRQPHGAVAAHQQRPADPLFHPADALAQRRLRDVEAIGGAAEVQRLGQRDERLEIDELDIHNHRLSDYAERFIGRHEPSGGIMRSNRVCRAVCADPRVQRRPCGQPEQASGQPRPCVQADLKVGATASDSAGPARLSCGPRDVCHDLERDRRNHCGPVHHAGVLAAAAEGAAAGGRGAVVVDAVPVPRRAVSVARLRGHERCARRHRRQPRLDRARCRPSS